MYQQGELAQFWGPNTALGWAVENIGDLDGAVDFGLGWVFGVWVCTPPPRCVRAVAASLVTN